MPNIRRKIVQLNYEYNTQIMRLDCKFLGTFCTDNLNVDELPSMYM